MAKKHKNRRIPVNAEQMNLSRMANDNLLLFKNHSNPKLLMQEIFDAADVVHAIVRDDTCPTGLDFYLVKGIPAMKAAVERNEPFTARVTALIFRAHEHAELARQMFGDGKHDAAND